MYDSDDDDYIDYEDFPDFFENFNDSLQKGISPGYYDPDELCEIAEIYFVEGQWEEGKYAINYALKIYPENEDMIYDLLLVLSDFEQWNDLLTLSEKYSHVFDVWPDAYKLTSLLHLGMEEDTFQYFKKLKSKYAGNKENLSLIYQAMAESLCEVDLYDASIEVIEEIIPVVGQDIDLLWSEIQAFTALEDRENVIRLGSIIQQLKPMDAENWTRLGNIYREINEINKSIEAYEFAQSLGIKDPEILLSLIYTYERNGNYAKALQKADEYLSKYPDSYLVNLLAINICLQIENWSEGLKYIENAIKLEPQIEFLYLYKCKFYLRQGENIKAIKALEEGINKIPEHSGDLKKQLKKLKKNI